MIGNQMGMNYKLQNKELIVSKLITIKDMTKEICNQFDPQPAEYELNLIYRGKDLSQSELKTLADYKFEDKGKILICKKALFDDFIGDDFGIGNIEIDDKDLENNLQTLKSFGIEHEDEVIKLALRKTKNDVNGALDMLMSDGVENLIKEVQEKELQKTFIPIIDKEPEKIDEDGENDNEEDNESKLNLILSNKSEYFDLLFDLLNLGVTEINAQAWNLLTQIPVNKELYSNIKRLDIIESSDWNKIMDSESMFKLLYSLQIINSLICSPDSDQIDENELQERYEWRLKFIKTGGFDHL